MCKAFYYKNITFSPETGCLTLTYGVDDQFVFTETITFPNAPFQLSSQQQQALERVFHLAHIAFGISYYKAFLPKSLIIETSPLTAQEARFFETFYLNGLGEFAIRNNLNLQGHIHFPSDKDRRPPIDLNLANEALIPVGGGKDSCVTIELMKQTDLPATTIAVGDARPIRDCMAVSGLPSLFIRRQLDPQLIELNASGHVYNGHVPITGLLAFVLWAAAILYNKRYVILSCERSANIGNLMQGDLAINHQYSKSIDFERDFYQLTQAVTPSFRYFSLLRPLSEAHIAKLFTELCSAYFPVFTSCNKAFKLDEKKRLSRWCGACDKCRFVFLILAPFMKRDTLIQAVGSNPLNDLSQLDGYCELLGLTGHKPFECVGEIDESRWAFHQLLKHLEWQNDAVIQALNSRVPLPESELILTPSNTHLIPQELNHVLDRFRH